MKPEAEVDPSVQQMVKEFEAIFAKPHGMPPPRSHNHKIQLQEGSKPTCVRPYRYLYYQREEREHLVAKMLSSGSFGVSKSLLPSCSLG